MPKTITSRLQEDDYKSKQKITTLKKTNHDDNRYYGRSEGEIAKTLIRDSLNNEYKRISWLANKNSNLEQNNVNKDSYKNDYDIIRDIVMSVSRGNIFLQIGKFITEENKSKMKDEISSYKIKAKIHP